MEADVWRIKIVIEKRDEKFNWLGEGTIWSPAMGIPTEDDLKVFLQSCIDNPVPMMELIAIGKSA